MREIIEHVESEAGMHGAVAHERRTAKKENYATSVLGVLRPVA
jgi:hypothetical protein